MTDSTEDGRFTALKKECKLQQEACFLLGAALYIWKRDALLLRNCLMFTTIVLGGAAIVQVLIRFGGEWADALGGVLIVLTACSIVAYIIADRIADLADTDQYIDEFFNLRDRFRQAAEIRVHSAPEEFDEELNALMRIKEATRKAAPSPPSWCFDCARKKKKKDFMDQVPAKN